jgi:hypothetical protein
MGGGVFMPIGAEDFINFRKSILTDEIGPYTTEKYVFNMVKSTDYPGYMAGTEIVIPNRYKLQSIYSADRKLWFLEIYEYASPFRDFFLGLVGKPPFTKTCPVCGRSCTVRILRDRLFASKAFLSVHCDSCNTTGDERAIRQEMAQLAKKHGRKSSKHGLRSSISWLKRS